MTSIELKKEIQSVLDKLPEESLADVLAFLRSIDELNASKVLMADNLRRILNEDKQLLEKLAQ